MGHVGADTPTVKLLIRPHFRPGRCRRPLVDKSMKGTRPVIPGVTPTVIDTSPAPKPNRRSRYSQSPLNRTLNTPTGPAGRPRWSVVVSPVQR